VLPLASESGLDASEASWQTAAVNVAIVKVSEQDDFGRRPHDLGNLRSPALSSTIHD